MIYIVDNYFFERSHLTIFNIFKGDAVVDIENIRSVTRRDVAVERALNKGARKGVGRVVSERGPCDVQRRAPAWCPESGPGLGQGLAIKAYRVAPWRHSVCSNNTQEKPPLAMKFFVSFFLHDFATSIIIIFIFIFFYIFLYAKL